MGFCNRLKAERSSEGGRCFSTGSDFSGDKCKKAIDECKKEIVNEADRLKESCNGEASLPSYCFSNGLIDYGKCFTAVDKCKKMKSEIKIEAGLVQKSCANGDKPLGKALFDACPSGGLIDYGKCKSAVDSCNWKIKDAADQKIMDEAEKLSMFCNTLKSERSSEGGRCFSTGSDFSGDKCRNAIDECKKEIVNEAVSLQESCATGKGYLKLVDACRSGGLI